MKDEAFEDIERRQGGFQAKRAMAADKLQEFCTCHETHPMECQGCRANRLAQPAQEPVTMRMPKVGDKVICLEDESLGTIVSLTAGGSPDIKFDDGSHGTYLLREFAELFCYASTPQREWVGLTDADIERIKLMTYEKETNADGEEQEAVNIDWLIKTTEHFCKEKNS